MYRAQDFSKLRLERFLGLLAAEAHQAVGATTHLKAHFQSLVPAKPEEQQVQAMQAMAAIAAHM